MDMGGRLFFCARLPVGAAGQMIKFLIIPGFIS